MYKTRIGSTTLLAQLLKGYPKENLNTNITGHVLVDLIGLDGALLPLPVDISRRVLGQDRQRLAGMRRGIYSAMRETDTLMPLSAERLLELTWRRRDCCAACAPRYCSTCGSGTDSSRTPYSTDTLVNRYTSKHQQQPPQSIHSNSSDRTT